MKCHELKIWRAPFRAIGNGFKKFEWRRDDRGYALHDHLLLREWDEERGRYTGNELEAVVLYLIRGPAFGIPDGYVIMSIHVPGFMVCGLADHDFERAGLPTPDEHTWSRCVRRWSGKHQPPASGGKDVR